MTMLTPSQLDEIRKYVGSVKDEYPLVGVNVAKILLSHIDELDKLLSGLSDYAAHDNSCIRSDCSAGEPLPDGGYQRKYRGKWYRVSPVDETPKCECGLDDILKRLKVCGWCADKNGK